MFERFYSLFIIRIVIHNCFNPSIISWWLLRAMFCAVGVLMKSVAKRSSFSSACRRTFAMNLTLVLTN